MSHVQPHSVVGEVRPRPDNERGQSALRVVEKLSRSGCFSCRPSAIPAGVGGIEATGCRARVLLVERAPAARWRRCRRPHSPAPAHRGRRTPPVSNAFAIGLREQRARPTLPSESLSPRLRIERPKNVAHADARGDGTPPPSRQTANRDDCGGCAPYVGCPGRIRERRDATGVLRRALARRCDGQNRLFPRWPGEPRASFCAGWRIPPPSPFL